MSREIATNGSPGGVWHACCAALALLLLVPACRGPGASSAAFSDPLVPSNDRTWQPSLAVLPTATVRSNEVTIRNIRNCYYFSEDVYAVRYRDKTFRLDDVKSVDFIVVPFKDSPSLAHTMLSFGFSDGDYLGVSIEARLEEGEVYSPIKGALRQYELMYVLADERDLISLRTEHRLVDVYLYRTNVKPEGARQLLIDMLVRANELARQPEFYDALTNNCTTNIIQHVNRIKPGKVPPTLVSILTGHSDRLAYDLGLLDTQQSFEATRLAARVNGRAHEYRDSAAFSDLIRR